MKLKLTYQPEEQEEADGVLAAILGLLPGVRVRRDKSKGPKQVVIYMTTRRPKPVAAVEKRLDPSPMM